ncbi:hypothetical protein SCLCIDRAFT_7820 [Scleroderma citrinum Foug A]|uniref:Uncharacterized protein n=1 Tax=Scleroderma citrinum Foug A TaxID=1036808 RepID=A0A0C3E1L4_9AGAM|nr:hypothetical protein SCLCIDRAFT_7820 [Scleroderma citrinum Foug A]
MPKSVLLGSSVKQIRNKPSVKLSSQQKRKPRDAGKKRQTSLRLRASKTAGRTRPTQAKMKKGAFCDLWYFTNQGLKAAEKSAASQEDLNYVAVCRDDNDEQVLVVAPTSDLPASKPRGKRGEAYKLIVDEDLSWEDFIKATPRIVVSMRDNDWAED